MTPEAFATLSELVPDALLLLEDDGRIVAANLRAQRMLQNGSADLTGRQLTDFVSDPPTNLDAHFRLCRRSCEEVVGVIHPRETGLPKRMFGRLLNRDNDASTPPLLLFRIPLQDTAVNRFVLLNRKIDELGREIVRRRLAENELLEQRDLAEFGRDIGLTLAEVHTKSAMLQRCAELIVKHLNAAFARIWTLRSGSDTLILRASAGLYTHLDGPHSRIRVGQYKIGEIARTRKPLVSNDVVADAHIHDPEWARREGLVGFAGYPLLVDGRVVGVMAMFARHRLSENRLSALDSVANSIALGIERKRIAVELKQNAESLRRADRRKNEFLAMLAHELRNPLAPIRSGLELLRLQSVESETINIMSQQVQHMARLVDDLLDVSRIMRDRIELRTESVSISEIIDHAVTTVRPTIENRRHTLNVSHCPEEIWLEADRVRLEQIFTNLLTNAAKYTPDGGQIDVTCCMDDASVVVTVRDNGVGIDADFLPEVFELFAQHERDLARSEGGLGIGLTLVRQLVQLHGGSVEVYSEGSGQGTEFTIRLPLNTSPAPPAPDDCSTDPQAIPDCRILVVDDSIGSARILRRLLAEIGVSAIEMAHDGPAALAAAEDFRPDIIFLDLGLPELNGFEVAERLRSDSRFTATRLVALTGYGTDEDRRRTREVGFDDHLVKPVGLDQLRQVLASGPNHVS
ncbi:ATP-binding protein [Maioricimonas sp. JC845]|uniref:hybrid sensor histidine kinase/response regulator n=1 Tax=Maioricimonas sp. JC845 TaxID=3232138 RepID=UPI0034583114